MSYEQYLFYTAQLSQMVGISSLPPLQRLGLGSSRTSNNLDKFTSNDGLTGTVVENLELVDHVTSVLGGVVHGVAASRLLTGVTLGKSLIIISKHISHTERGYIPSRGSWRASIHGGCQGLSRQPRRKRCWLRVGLVE